VALLAILAALATATPTVSDEAFQSFKALCAQTGGDVAASVAAADKAGWDAVPEQARQRLATGVDDPKTLQARLKRMTDGYMILSVDRSSRPIGGETLTSNHCQLNIAAGDYPALVALSEAWAAVPAMQGPDPAKGATFVFADEKGRHGPLSRAEIDGASAKVVRSRRITQFTIYNLSRGVSLRLDIPVR
jgi:hypothetical protein